MKKDYQTRTTAAATTVESQLPEVVSVTLAELGLEPDTPAMEIVRVVDAPGITHLTYQILK